MYVGAGIPMDSDDWGKLLKDLDAVGGAIHHIGNVHKYARKEDLPEKTLFVITTDGMENAPQSVLDIGEQILSSMTKFVPPQCYICFRVEKSALLFCSKLKK